MKESCGLRAHDIKFLRYLIKDAENYISEPINFIGGGRKWRVPRCPLRARTFYLGVIFWQYTEGFCLDHCWWPCVEKDVRLRGGEDSVCLYTAEPYTLIPSQGWLTGMQSKLMMNLSDSFGLRIVKWDLQQHWVSKEKTGLKRHLVSGLRGF